MGLKNRLAKLRSGARTLWKDTGGQSLMIFGLMAVPLCGAVGIGLDVAQWTVWKRQLHSAADAAALAGATANAESKPYKNAAERSLALNNLRTFKTVAIENAPTVGPYKGNATAVRVVLETTQQLGFSGMFLKSPPALRVEATAIASREVPNCVYALDTTAGADVLAATGSSSVVMNCGMTGNANVNISTSDTIKAGAISSVGSVQAGTGLDPSTKINEGVQPAADPLAGKLTIPDITAMCAGASFYTVKSKQWGYPTPGCYTGMKSLGGMVLGNGTYYIDGGDVTVGAQSLIKCDSCTIVFTNSDPSPTAPIGKFTAAGNSYIQLKAQTTGPFAGILLYQDKRAVPGNGGNFFITGNNGTSVGIGNSYLQGTIYTPSTYTTFSGNSGLETPCMQIVSLRVEFTGNTNVVNNCPAGSGASSFGGTVTLRLVA